MFLFESPWPILCLGVAVEVVLAIALVRTGRGVLLGAMVGVALLTLAGLGVERWVVTDRKLVKQAVYGLADAVQANDLKRALTFIAPSAKETQQEARGVQRDVEVVELTLHNLDVVVNREASPRTAQATFTVVVTGKGKGRYAEFGEQTHVVKVTLQLRLESGRWLVTDHDINQDPRQF